MDDQRSRGYVAALHHFGIKEADWKASVSNAASKGLGAVSKASRAFGTLPTGLGNVGSAALGAITQGASNVMSAKPGLVNKAKAWMTGGVSGAMNGLPFGLGWASDGVNKTMNKMVGVRQ